MMTTVGVGRLVRDPELKAVGDTHVCEFSLAVNEHRKIGGERKKFAHFFDFVIWDKAAETLAKYCHKGDLLEVTATPRQDKWKDTEDRNRSRIVFRVNSFEFLPRGNPQSVVENDIDEPVDEDEVTPF